MKRYLYNLILSILPSTRFFRFKSILFSLLCGSLGKNVRINQRSKIFGDSKVHIGDNSWIGFNCLISVNKPASVNIGKNCDVGPNVSIISGTHEIGNSTRRAGKEISHDIKIGDGVWIGSSCTINGGSHW